MRTDLVARIKKANLNRDPNFLAIKYKEMYDDKYRFFRATAYLFFEDIPADSFIYKAPPVWICGDLHLENFGSYRGDNGVAYFNINDFDEAILASPLLDVVRLLSSIHIAADNLKFSKQTIIELNDIFVNTYFDKLKEGYIRVIEKTTTKGVIKQFLKYENNLKRKDFLKKRTVYEKGKVKLLIDNIRTVKIKKEEKRTVIEAVEKWASKIKKDNLYNVKDVALRITGTASLGLKRYAVLINGKRNTGALYLLDIKEARPSCLADLVKVKQPKWLSEAERVIEIEKRFISDPPALLQSITIQHKNFVLKELQPTANRINYKLFAKDFKKISSILSSMACIYAWSNLRTTGRQGAAIADDLILFANNNLELKKQLTEYAYSYSEKMDIYHKQYCKAFAKGAFKTI